MNGDSQLPIWLLALIFLAALILARELGYACRRWRRTDEDDKGDAFAMTSILGLLALLIGFTYALALQRYDARRELVIAEANALGTTWLRLQVLDDPDRSRIQGIMRRYVTARIAYGNAGTDREEMERYEQTDALQRELWQAVVASVEPFKQTALASLLLSTTNESIDLAASRLATRQAHIPQRLMRTLLVFAVAAAGMVGFERGKQRTATTLLFVLLTLAVVVIVDLERPTTGAIDVPQQPMLDLQRSMA